MQRLKRADARSVPTFEDVVARPVRKLERRSARRPQLAIACGLAAALFAAFWFVRQQPTNSVLQPSIQIADDEPPSIDLRNESVAEIDFDQLRRAIEEHFKTTETASSLSVPLWSSRTESLLAVNLDLPSDRE